MRQKLYKGKHTNQAYFLVTLFIITLTLASLHVIII